MSPSCCPAAAAAAPLPTRAWPTVPPLFAPPSLRFLSAVRPLTEDETKVVFEKLHKFIGALE